MVNLYTKSGIVVDIESEALRKSDGSLVSNATPEMWKAEGWKPYKVPKTAKVKLEKTLAETREEILREARNYYLERKDRLVFEGTSYLLSEISSDIEDLREFVQVMKDEDKVMFLGEFYVTKDWLSRLFLDMRKHKFACFQNFSKHFKEISYCLKTKESLLSYDYTKGYPQVPKFTV